MRAKIENTGTKSVRWGAGGCNLPARIWIDLSTAFAGGREWPGLLGRFKSVALDGRYGSPATSNYVEQALLERSEHETVLCRASLTVLELAAGATLEMRAAWDGKLAGSPAPSGPAVVEAEFPFMGIAGVVDPNNFEIKPISVRVSTHVAGPPASVALAPAAAIDVALADPDFASFVLAEPESTWVNPDVAVIEGNWWVTLFRSRNADPAVTLRGTVMVDHDGKVVGHRFE